MVCGIYSITNIANNKRYIGQSTNVHYRLKRHFKELENQCHVNKHMQNAFNKYGAECFETDILKACKKRYLNRFEKLYIKIYNSNDNGHGYNKTIGGDVPPVNYNYRNDVRAFENNICQEYITGASYTSLADKYDCSQWLIRKIIFDNNIPFRKYQQSHKRKDVWDRKQEVCEFYLEGNTLRKTSEKFNVSSYVIVNILKDGNVTIRSNSDVMKGKHFSPNTEFKKGCIPYNKGKGKIDLKGGEDYIIDCIVKGMNREDIVNDLGYTSFKSVANYMSKHNMGSFDELCIELGKKYCETGYYRVSILNRPHLKKGYSYLYHSKDGKKHNIESTNLKNLESLVKLKGYEWRKL